MWLGFFFEKGMGGWEVGVLLDRNVSGDGIVIDRIPSNSLF